MLGTMVRTSVALTSPALLNLLRLLMNWSEKINQFSASTGIVRSYLKLQKNYHLIDQKMFFCNSPFNFHLDIYEVFKETVSFSFTY